MTAAALRCSRQQPASGRLHAAGLVSLHQLRSPVFGPPFMHMRAPEAAVFVGDVTVESDPLRCMAAIAALLEQYRCAVQPAPLVVNTHGWVKVGPLAALARGAGPGMT